MGKIIAVCSGKGGVGKSSVSAGLGVAFSNMGKKVLLVDMDEGLRCLDLMLDVDREAVFDLSDIILGKEIEEVAYKSPLAQNLYLVIAPAKEGMVDEFSLSSFAKGAAGLFDIVIFDFPAGLNLRLYTSLPETTQYLTVAVPDPISIRDASVIGEKISSLSLNARLIVNRFKYKQSLRHRVKNIDSIIDNTSIRLIGIVPESKELSELSLRHRIPKKSGAAKAFERIANRLDGMRVLLPVPKKI